MQDNKHEKIINVPAEPRHCKPSAWQNTAHRARARTRRHIRIAHTPSSASPPLNPLDAKRNPFHTRPTHSQHTGLGGRRGQANAAILLKILLPPPSIYRQSPPTKSNLASPPSSHHADVHPCPCSSSSSHGPKPPPPCATRPTSCRCPGLDYPERRRQRECPVGSVLGPNGACSGRR